MFNQRKESRERHPIKFKQKRKASELAEAKPEDILPFIYQPEGMQAKADSGPCLELIPDQPH